MTDDVLTMVNKSEECFLAAVQRNDVPLATFIEMLDRFLCDGEQEKADTCAEMLRESLVERNEYGDAVRLLEIQSGWHANEMGYASVCEKRLATMFQNTPSVLKLIPHMGFSKGLPPSECLRRLQVLIKLEPEVLCYDKTWGFGVVRGIDENMNQIVIDFKMKEQHRMSLAYACETLNILENDHVLAEQYRNPSSFTRRVEEAPTDVVKDIIRDFGPMNVMVLQELVVANVDAVAEWKPFWENARKQLKRDPLIVMPKKRNDPIQVLKTKEALNNHWIQVLRRENDPARILALIEDWKNKKTDADIPAILKDTLEERLSFVEAEADRNMSVAVHALLMADELGLSGSDERKNSLVDRLLDTGSLLKAIHDLPARSVARLISFLSDQRPEVFKYPMMKLIPDLRLQDLNIVIDSLLSLGFESHIAQVFHSLTKKSDINIDAISWMCGHIDFVFTHKICEPEKFAFMALTALETARVTGKNIQPANKIRDCFRNDAWIKKIADPLDELQRSDLVLRLKRSPAFQESERNMTIARLTKLFPDLKAGLKSAPVQISNQRLTSMRSYADRQLQLRKLLNTEVPQNIRDIAEARSYGDLSENYEYHSARETQRMLMDRRNELEKSLNEVQATAFENAPYDKAGMGTCVTLRYDSGDKERYTILGEWDNHEDLKIISLSSRLAQILAGHQEGDEVFIPKESGDVRCVIETISGLPDDIRAWIHDVPDN